MGPQIPQELSRQHSVCAGEERRTGPGDSHLQAWPGTYGIQSNGAVGLWPPTERVALISGMLCTLGNELWRMEGDQILAQRHMRENGACVHKSGKCAGQNCTCDASYLERRHLGPPSGRRRCTKDKVTAL
jgi:hypothetical protein